MGAGGDGPLGGMAGMEPHHMNGSLGTGINSLYSICCIDTKSLVMFFLYLPINLSKTSVHAMMVICVIFILVFPLSGSGDMDSLPKVFIYFETPVCNCTAHLA